MTTEDSRRFLRLYQIIGKPARKGRAEIPALIPVSKTTWWEGVRTGRFPAPVRGLGQRITAWRSEEIFALIDRPESRGNDGSQK